MARPLRAALGWTAFLVLLLGTALLAAPPLHRWLVEIGIGRPDRFDRTVRYLVFVPFLLVFFARTKPWRDGSPFSYGRPDPGVLARAWGVTFALLVAMLALQFALGWIRWEDPISGRDVARRLLKFFASGWLVAALEEWFFRGWLDRRFRRSLSPRAAALLVAAIFAVLHVFTLKSGAEPAAPTREGVLAVYGLWAGRLLDPAYAVPKLVGLVLFSLVLTAAMRRAGTLAAAVGIHAAAICVIYSYGALTDRVLDPSLWTGTKRLYDGPLGWLALGVALFVLAGKARRDRPRGPADGEARPDV